MPQMSVNTHSSVFKALKPASRLQGSQFTSGWHSQPPAVTQTSTDPGPQHRLLRVRQRSVVVQWLDTRVPWPCRSTGWVQADTQSPVHTVTNTVNEQSGESQEKQTSGYCLATTGESEQVSRLGSQLGFDVWHGDHAQQTTAAFPVRLLHMAAPADIGARMPHRYHFLSCKKTKIPLYQRVHQNESPEKDTMDSTYTVK